MAWPWPREPSTCAFVVEADFPTIAAIGIAATEEELRQLTAMICSGVPDKIEFVAKWRGEAAGAVSLSVDVPGEVQFYQTFERTPEGLCAHQGVFWIQEKYREGGHAWRLMRALAHVYEDLNVVGVTTTAGMENGGYTWAAAGARAVDAGLHRRELVKRLDVCITKGEIDADYRDAVVEAIKSAKDDDLMLTVAALGDQQGAWIGKAMLVSYTWDAYWKPSDPRLRQYLIRVLLDDDEQHTEGRGPPRHA